MAENIFATNNQSAKLADWTPVAGFFSGLYHLSYGCQKLCNLKNKKVIESSADKIAKTPATSSSLQDRNIVKLSPKQDAMGHIRRALLLILLPVIGSLFLMVYDLITRHKAHKSKPTIVETLPIPVPPLPTQQLAPVEMPAPPEEPPKMPSPKDVFLAKFAKIKNTPKLAKCFFYKYPIEYHTWVAEEMTVEEIERAVAKNWFQLFESPPSILSDRLNEFTAALTTEKRKAFVRALLKRPDLKGYFFNRLLLIADSLKPEQRKEVYEEIFKVCLPGSKYYNLLNTLHHDATAAKLFVSAFLKHSEEARHMLLKKCPIACLHVITEMPVSEELKQWMADNYEKTPNLLQADDHVHEFKKIRHDPTAVRFFFSYFGHYETTEIATLNEKFFDIAPIMTEKEIEQYASMEENCFHINSYYNNPTRLSTLFSCLSPKKKMTFIKTTMKREDLGGETFCRLCMHIASECHIGERKDFYLCLFDAIRETRRFAVLENLQQYYHIFSDKQLWSGSIDEAHFALFIDAMQTANPIETLKPFAKSDLFSKIFSRLPITFQNEDLKKALHVFYHVFFPALVDPIVWQTVKTDPIELKKIDQNVVTVGMLKKFISLFDPNDFPLLVEPEHDILSLHYYLTNNKSHKRFVTVLECLFTSKAAQLLQCLKNYPKTLNKFFTTSFAKQALAFASSKQDFVNVLQAGLGDEYTQEIEALQVLV